MTVPTTTLQPDPVFFPMAEFQVDGFLFRVPLYIFQQSPYFRENVLGLDEGRDTDAPYELQDTTAAEFRDLLRSILPMAGPFPRYGTQVRHQPESKLPVPPSPAVARLLHLHYSGPTALTNVLKLATRWQFAFARRVAIRKISYTVDNPALKLALAREYDVAEFLPGALGALVDAKALEVADYETLSALDLDLVAKVVEDRERSRCARCNLEQPKSAAAIGPDQRRRLVEDIFGAEFARDYRTGEEILAARAMTVTQRPPPSQRCCR